MTIKNCEFIVAGKPTGKARPRFTKQSHAYTPKETRQRETLIKQTAWVAMQNSRLKVTDRRVSVIVSFYFDVPKSYTKTKTILCQSGVLVPSKPDIDNLAKAVLDGCNEVVYRDDAQVWHLSAFKSYCKPDQKAETHIKIQWDELENFAQ